MKTKPWWSRRSTALVVIILFVILNSLFFYLEKYTNCFEPKGYLSLIRVIQMTTSTLIFIYFKYLSKVKNE